MVLNATWDLKRALAAGAAEASGGMGSPLELGSHTLTLSVTSCVTLG